ncbi:MAG: insulinase family protein [Gemmatimonadetes bacterium]|nr:insulinase family protein [Gemmatimonadota bacterium]
MVRGLQYAAGLLCLITALPADRLSAQNAGRINYETFTMPNGLRVVLSEDHSTPIVTVNVWYYVGSANERVGRSGFAHLFEHMMFQGSAHVGKAEHFKLIERAGGGLNGSTRTDRTNYYQTLPSNRLNLGLWLEADRMRSLAVTGENFENQRQAVKEERRLRVDNQPYVRPLLEALALPFDSATCFAYAHTVIGNMADLDSARVEDVQAFFHQFYAPNNAVLAVVGDFDAAEARRLIEQYFGSIPRASEAPAARCESEFGRGPRRMDVTDSLANLPAVFLVYMVPSRNHEDAPALELLATILGSGESSRLNRRLVREERAALGAAQESDLRVGPGVLLFYGITNQGVEASRLEQLMGEEIDRARNDSVVAAELTKARNQYRAGAIRERQTTQDVAEALQSALLYAGSLESVNTEIQRFMGVTTADLTRVARRYLAPENRLTVIVNPPAGRGGND